MRLPFQRSDRAERAPDPAHRPADAGDDAAGAARTQARRRLIGAFVLLAVGIVGFPILFETQPRPLPASTPIITAQGEPIATGPAPTSRAAPARAPSAAPEGPAAVTPAEPVPAPAPAAASAAPIAPPAAAPSATAPPAPASKPSAMALVPTAPTVPTVPTVPTPAPRHAASKAAEPVPAEGRFVVQVGAFSDSAMLREARQKVEKLGLKTYTQVIEGDAVKRTRVRVGPFVTRAEAQAAAAKLKAAGLPANLLAL